MAKAARPSSGRRRKKEEGEMISSNCHVGKEEGGEWNDAGPVLEALICCSLHTMFIGRFHKLGSQFQIGLSDSKPQTEPIHVSRTGLVAAAAEGEGDPSQLCRVIA